MRSKVTLRPVRGHPRYSWRVCYPEMQPDGSSARRQSFFTDKKSGMAFVAKKEAQLANFGIKHADISDGERAAVVHFRQWASTRGDAPSLLDLIRAGIVRAEENRPRLTVAQVIVERRNRITVKQRSARHDKDTRLRLEKFEAVFGTRQIADITSGMVEEWLHGLKLSPVSMGNYRRALNAIFAHALKRRAIAANPIGEVDIPEAESAIPTKLSPKELELLLHAARPEIRPSLAIQAFAGVRRAEMERLDWRNVDLAEDHIRVDAAIAKTSSRRIIPIPPVLAQWLALDAQKEGKIAPTPQIYRDRLEAAWRAAEMASWPSNCLRHSAATYLLAREENAERVALWLGNSPRMLKRHYDALATKAEAEKWFAVTPDSARFHGNTPIGGNGNEGIPLETRLETKGKTRKRAGNGA